MVRHYRISAESPAVDAGINLGSAHGFDLTPKSIYLHPTRNAVRRIKGALDAGAYEFLGER